MFLCVTKRGRGSFTGPHRAPRPETPPPTREHRPGSRRRRPASLTRWGTTTDPWWTSPPHRARHPWEDSARKKLSFRVDDVFRRFPYSTSTVYVLRKFGRPSGCHTGIMRRKVPRPPGTNNGPPPPIRARPRFFSTNGKAPFYVWYSANDKPCSDLRTSLVDRRSAKTVVV